MAAVAEDSREQQLAWEARQRPRAAIAAILAGVLPILGQIWLVLTVSDGPRAGYLESLSRVGSERLGDQPSLLTPGLQFLNDHALGYIGSGLVTALGSFALAWAITFIAVAVRARRPEFPRIAVYIALVGAVVGGLATLVGRVATVIGASDFLDGPRTVDQAVNFAGPVLETAQFLLVYVAPFITGAGLLLVSLNAMRTGLLTRFLGILGVVSGVFAVLPVLMPMPIIQSFWLMAAGFMLLGGGRAGLPPAWRTGQAEPWPSAVEAANQRRAAEERRQGIRPKAEAQPEAARVPAGKPHPSSKKRKRKRRD